MGKEITVKEEELRELLEGRKKIEKENKEHESDIERLTKNVETFRKDNKELTEKLTKKHKTKFCWNCIKEIPENEFVENELGFRKDICNRCITRQDKELEIAQLTVVEENRKPQHSQWHRGTVVITDVSLQDKHKEDKETGEKLKYFIKGYIKGESQHEMGVFTRIQQFIKTERNFIGTDPFVLIAMMDKYKYQFGRHYECALHKLSHGWEFHGNMEQISNVFRTVIYSKEYVELLAKTLMNRRHIFIDLEKNIWDYKDKNKIKTGENIWEKQKIVSVFVKHGV